jgi:multisubunit Na+/H+ antiporter MnhG subunit
MVSVADFVSSLFFFWATLSSKIAFIRLTTVYNYVHVSTDVGQCTYPHHVLATWLTAQIVTVVSKEEMSHMFSLPPTKQDAVFHSMYFM